MGESKKGPAAAKRAPKQSELEKRTAALLAANEKRRHTASVILFAAGLFLLAVAFIGDAAAENPSAWDIIHGFLYGMTGLSAFLTGPALIVIAVMITVDLTGTTIRKRIFQLILLLLLISAAAQVFFVGTVGDPSHSDTSFGDTLAYTYDCGKQLIGGGVMGLVLGFPLLLFGQVGAIIILVLVVFVAVMIIADKSLADLFNAVAKPAKVIKEHHERAAEERELLEPELRRMEEEQRQLRQEKREQRQHEKAARRAEREMNEEIRRRDKFAAIASVTTGAQQEVTEEDKKQAAVKQLETSAKDPVAEQKKESAEFQKDLREYLNVKYDRNSIDRPPAFPDEEIPLEPYRPDMPKFADEEAPRPAAVSHIDPWSVGRKPAEVSASAEDVPASSGSEQRENLSAESTENKALMDSSSVPENDTQEDHAVGDVNTDEAAATDKDTAASVGDTAATENEHNIQVNAENDLTFTSGSEDNSTPVDAAASDSSHAPWESLPERGDIQTMESVSAINSDNRSTDIVEVLKDFSAERNESEKRAEENARTLEEASLSGNSQLYAVEGEQYTLPPLDLLNDVIHERSDEDINAEIRSNAEKLVSTLKSFGVETTFIEASRGPSVTRYELRPAPGVKISKITGLVDDIALNLASAGVRIEAPIPNKAAVGIEVPNRTVDSVPFREMVDTKEFRDTKSRLGAVLGKSISGDIVIADIAKMPHILIAGTTGSGKSVCVNSIIMSILFRSTPDEVSLLMIDPKAVEFMIYNGIPHLLIPVVTDPKKASGALAWAVTEMLNRYKMFSDNNVRDLAGYNKVARTREDLDVLPQIVIFIDELADLMMASPGEVEDSICRLAQMARAAGMHLVIATQRPSVNVVTGVIKANIPSRIALKVASQVDSRTIIDGAGAEKLLGKGDMLYAPVGMAKPMRVQGCWVSDKEVERVVDFIKNSFNLEYNQGVIDEIERQVELAAQKAEKGGKKQTDDDEGGVDVNDDKLDEAIEAVIEAGQASTSYLQRRLKLGYGRAARLIDTMEQLGIVGGFEGSKARQVIMTKQEWYERKMNRSE